MKGRLLVGFLAFTVMVLVALEVPLGLADAARQRGTAQGELTREALALSAFGSESVEHHDLAQLQALVTAYALRTGTDVAVIGPSGRLMSSAGSPAAASLPAALGPSRTAQVVAGAQLSGLAPVAGGPLSYAAVPLGHTGGAETRAAQGGDGGVSGIILVGAPADQVAARIHHYWLELALVGVGVLAAAAALGVVLARTLTRPLARVEAAVAALGAGALEARAPAEVGPAELRQLAATFNTMAGRLAELVTSQRAFAADASHQLRTPLTALRLGLENLAPAVAADHQDDVRRAIGETGRLSRLVDGLLTLARAEVARPERAMVDVTGLLDQRAQAWSPLAEERGVRLACHPSPGALSAWMVPGALDQVLDNLLDNAIEASPAGSCVSLAAQPEGPLVEIHVADEGAGMSEADRARAFDRFWRRQPGSTGGSGLGLAIVAQLVGSSGGSVELIERHPRGLDAVVRLQAARPPA